jgi:hypothetical protein
MPGMTAGYAKNTIRRALRAVVDPGSRPTEVAELWEFFGSACAYCGRKLRKGGREGHVDHLNATSTGGTNHISNRVLSCPECNGNEKLERPWLEFLRERVKDRSLFNKRRKRIEAWMRRELPKRPSMFDSELLNRETERAVAAFDEAVAQLRGTGSET